MFLSASTNGRQIEVTSTTSSGANLIHTSVSGTVSIDSITLVANNTSASSVDLTIEYGGTGQSDLMVFALEAKETQKILLLNFRLNNGLTINAFAGTGNVINIYGHVNRMVL